MNPQASSFTPSWYKKPAAAPATAPVKQPAAADTPPPAPARADPNSQIPWQPPVGAAATAPSHKLSATAQSFAPTNALGQQRPPAQWGPGIGAKSAPPPRRAESPQAKKPLIVNKTDAEVQEISQRSTLSIAASAFVPSLANAKRVVQPGKVSPLALGPIAGGEAPDELHLGDVWSLHFIDAPVAGEDDFDPVRVFRVDCVSMFWRTMNNLPPPERLALGSTMFLFRDDVQPRWEDKRNADGGLYRFKVPEKVIDDAWLMMCCRTIGESWKPEYREHVNGIVLKVREKGFWIEIWVTKELEDFGRDVLSAVESVLPGFNIDFMMHSETQKFRAKTAAQTPSKKNTKRRK